MNPTLNILSERIDDIVVLLHVREWVEQRRQTIEQVCDIEIRATDFSDDHLSIVRGDPGGVWRTS